MEKNREQRSGAPEAAALTHEDAIAEIRRAVREIHARTGSIEDTFAAARLETAAVHRVIIDHAIGLAIREVIYEVRLAERRRMKHESPLGLDARSEAGARLLGQLLETWRIGGKALGDCTGAELLAEAAGAEHQAEGYLRNAAFYRRLAERVGPDGVVRERVTSEQAAAVLSEVCAPSILEAVPKEATTAADPGEPLLGRNPREPRSPGSGRSMVPMQPSLRSTSRSRKGRSAAEGSAA